MSTKKNLYVEPVNGLCNRLRVVDSAYGLAQDLDLDITLVWDTWTGMSGTLDRIIEIPSIIKIICNYSGINRLDSLKKELIKLRVRLVNGRIYQDQQLHSEEVITQFKKDINDKRSVYISAYSRFYKTKNPYHWLIPTSRVMNQVEQLIENINIGHMIGVHIRRGDATKARKYSPVKYFVESMGREIDADSDCRFYLASDSRQVEDQIINRYGDRITVNSGRDLDRTNSSSSIGAMVDLMCLSRTKRILGTYWSSFSRTASEIGNIPLLIIKDPSVES